MRHAINKKKVQITKIQMVEKTDGGNIPTGGSYIGTTSAYLVLMLT